VKTFHPIAPMRADDDVLGDGTRNVGPEDSEGHKIKESGPYDGQPRGEDPRRHDRGDRVGGVVESIGEVERQRDRNDRPERE
jgi:hypothetical protein